jgi:hypothetical protein
MSCDEIALEDRDAFTVKEFCAKHGFSRETFYKRRAQMPKSFTIGVKRFITREEAARWRRERDRAATV